MISQVSRTLPGFVGAIAATLFYGLSFWRIARKNPDNKVIECGVLTIMVMLAMAFLSRVIDLPDWAFGSLITLLFLLCMATLFFVAQRAWRGLRNRKSSHSEGSRRTV
jgi:hypothetical protein